MLKPIKIIGLFAIIGVVVFLLSCGGGSSSGEDSAASGGGTTGEETSGDGGGTDSGGTVTLTGDLSITSGSSNIAKSPIEKAASGAGYFAYVVNASTGGQAKSEVASDGSFSFTLSADTGYIINFLDNDYKYIGTLATASAGTDNTVPIALTTSSNGNTDDIGTITVNTTTGQAVSNADLNEDTTYMAYTSGGVIAGGNSGEGSTNYEAATVTDSIADASDPDDDNDGVPDVFDTDNDNNGYADEIDGTTDYCKAGTLSLYVENYPGGLAASSEQQQFPRPSEVSASLASGTQYQIHIELAPGNGYTISDISEVAVSAPSYVDTYGYVYSNYTNASSCFNVLWTTCNSKKLILSNDGTKFEAAIADKNVGTSAGILEGMYPGDTFILAITMADGSSYTCSKKINIIPKYYPYNLKKDGTLLDTSVSMFTGWSGQVALSWSIPSEADGNEIAVGPAGLTYKLGITPYDASCSPSAADETLISAGQDVKAKTLTVPNDLPASAINVWGLKVYAVDDIGDQSYTGSISFTSDSSAPGVCGI